MPTRRQFVLRGFAAGAAALVPAAGCQSDRPMRLFGYDLGSEALYDTSIKTISVRMFTNRAFQTGPYRGMEAAITAALVREINTKTPYRIISDDTRADTELVGNLAVIDKQILNRNQQNTVREGHLLVSCDVVWRDLRDGRILSNPTKPGQPNVVLPDGTQFEPFDPSVELPPPASPVPNAMPQRIVGDGRYLPELGESNASAEQRVANQIAVQIVSMMEKPWVTPGQCADGTR